MSITLICEERGFDSDKFMLAVEEFVVEMMGDVDSSVIDVTAKKLLGVPLTHDEIMIESPRCTKHDLIIVERDLSKIDYSSLSDKEKVWYQKQKHTSRLNDVEFFIGASDYIKLILRKLKIGKKGLLTLYKTYLEIKKENPRLDDYGAMVQAGKRYGLGNKESQILITRMIQKHNRRKLMALAEEAMLENSPTNTSGSVMGDHEPTDGKPGKVVKRECSECSECDCDEDDCDCDKDS